MNNPLQTIEDYELFLYSIKEQFPFIRHSTLVLIRRGISLARVSGELQFDHGIRVSDSLRGAKDSRVVPA